MAKTFEECIILIEHLLGIHLLSWQEEILRAIYEDRPIYYRPARGVGITTLDQAIFALMLLKGEYENEE